MHYLICNVVIYKIDLILFSLCDISLFTHTVFVLYILCGLGKSELLKQNHSKF